MTPMTVGDIDCLQMVVEGRYTAAWCMSKLRANGKFCRARKLRPKHQRLLLHYIVDIDPRAPSFLRRLFFPLFRGRALKPYPNFNPRLPLGISLPQRLL